MTWHVCVCVKVVNSQRNAQYKVSCLPVTFTVTMDNAASVQQLSFFLEREDLQGF